jgi:putative membrane protein
MFGQLIISILIGITAGIFTGLCPGVHINLVAVTLVTVSPLLLHYTNPLILCVFIIAMSVTHTFLDVIPSIYLGAPESATALGVLPGHRYLLKGWGLMAVKLSLIGAFGAVILSIIMFPLFLLIVKYGYPILENYIGYVLIAVCIFMILRDRHLLWAVAVFFISGILGVVVFSIPTLKDPLFPLLSGLFGISTLLISLNESQNIPPQEEDDQIKTDWKTMVKALLSGQFSGFITAVMPGLGASTAAVISLQITRNLGDHGFMMLMGSIGTANFVLSLAALWELGKARNGSIIAVQELFPDVSAQAIIVFLCATLIAGSISVYLVLTIGRTFSRLITRIDYQKLVIGIICFVTMLVIILTGWIGLIVLITSTAAGLVPAITKVTRTHAMGCLLLPVILYFVL